MQQGPRIPLIDLNALHRPIRRELNEAIGRVIDRGDFILGEEVEHFEAEFAAYCGVRYGVGVDSGLSALELILLLHRPGYNRKLWIGMRKKAAYPSGA